ncbi:S-adenosyl-L-methionine-dependent methyltransferases superfamily protein [Perilla frutescens var. frutescens]|nr:S-adenosyl-L-methionine-dependent methyltransferases superfamily protein [Perilla frutescens var. frutescens]
MGRKNKQKQKVCQEGSQSRNRNQDDLLQTLGNFTLKENWDDFFTLRGADDSFEWYAEWPQLQSLLTGCLLFDSSELLKSPTQRRWQGKLPEELRILVPGCGNSRLSEHLYDDGFRNITNVDFSRVVITDMLKRNVRERPEMKWRVMDMTAMKFQIEEFHAVVDKGGLDALMEPKLGPRLGNLYLSEVKRILKAGGKYICLTLAESHVLDLLFYKFRFGWKMSFHTIAQEPSFRKPKLQTFVVVAEKDHPSAISDISLFMDNYFVECHDDQARELREALEKEKKVRAELSTSSNVSYSLEDLKLGAKGSMSVFEPGRRIKLILGEPGVSNFFYNGVLLDAKQDSGCFIYHYGVFLVPKLRAHAWLYASEEGQWLIVESSKAARLLMVFLDSSNSIYSMEEIQADLSPLVKQLSPGYTNDDNNITIPFLAAGDGIKEREIVHQVMSDLSGPVVVEDVTYLAINEKDAIKGLKYRRLIFERTENLVQSEALLSTKGSSGISSEAEKEREQEAPKPRNKASSGEMEIVHNFLASSYHIGIVSGMLLIWTHLNLSNSFVDLANTVVLGLGAGLLPMFLKINQPSLKIEVVELDPVVLEVAREYFGFQEDEHLEVHITDGIKFVKDRADPEAAAEKRFCKIDILIVDVDSSDTRSGLTCPDPNFVEESFISAAKESLSEHGLFIINLVSRSTTVKDAVHSRLKKVFSNIFSLKLEEDVNEVLFALKTDAPIKEEQLSEARNALAISLEEVKEEPWSEKALHLSKSIELLK